MTPLQSNMLGVDIFILKGFSRIFQERVSEICNQMIKRYTLCVVTEQDFTSWSWTIATLEGFISYSRMNNTMIAYQNAKTKTKDIKVKPDCLYIKQQQQNDKLESSKILFLLIAQIK